jgi:tellurite resistance protein
MAAPSDDDTFNLEVMKLLVKIARVDNEFDEHERQMILGVGRSWGVADAAVHALLSASTVEPDMQVLKTRADDVITAARALVLSDGKVKLEESALLKQIAQALGAA